MDSDDSNTFKEYIEIYNDSIEKYGEKTAVLYQCGSFYELYGVNNEIEKLGNIEEITNVLNIQLTRKKKAIKENSRKNPLFAGFNMLSTEKYVKILMDSGYTAVIVNQEGTVGGKGGFKRSINSVFSPGTYIENQNAENYLLCIYINKYEIGLCAFDISVGIIYLYNINIKCGNGIEDCYRFFDKFKPKEVLIIYNDVCEPTYFNGVFDKNVIIHKKNQLNKDFLNIKFQNEFLGRFYDSCGFLYPIEFLNLEKYVAGTTALCLLFNFCIEHNPKIMDSLKNIPINIWDDDNNLILENNTIAQLNLEELYNLFNKDIKTKMGSRLLKDYLYSPIYNLDIINSRYDIIDNFIRLVYSNEEKKNELLGSFKYLKLDLDKYHTKIKLDKIKLEELCDLITYYKYAINLINSCDKIIPYDKKIVADFIEFYEFLAGAFQSISVDDDLERPVDINIFFSKTYAPNLHELQELKKEKLDILEEIKKTLSDNIKFAQLTKSNKINLKDSFVKLEYSNEIGYYFSLTNLRYEILKKNFKPFTIKLHTIKLEEFTVAKKASEIKLYNGGILYINDEINEYISEIYKLINLEFNNLLDKIKSKSAIYNYISNLIAEIDLFFTMANISDKYKYVRPNISCDKSFINIENMRHPLIERQDLKNKYIPITIDLNESGILLYGINSSGKSSTMKAIGLTIIMAQAGFFVPGTNCEIGLYKNIMTRILNIDNIFKGLSSFAVEMIELKSILEKMSNKSLVLGDEICHGTETESAVSIVTGSIILLSEINASFIFATHLHKLSEIDEINKLENVKQFHLTVQCNEETGELYYDRKLNPGAGISNYGIEVAKFLKLSPKLISIAIDIRNKYFNQKKKIKISKYNKSVICDTCKICDRVAVDVHHIYHQSETNNEYVDNMYIHDKKNLVALCEIHHNMVHNVEIGGNELIIFGYNGDNLEYTIRPRKF